MGAVRKCRLAQAQPRHSSVGDIQVVQSLDGGDLDQAAIDAAREWQFTPGMLDGRPVPVFVLIELLFTLR